MQVELVKYSCGCVGSKPMRVHIDHTASSRRFMLLPSPGPHRASFIVQHCDSSSHDPHESGLVGGWREQKDKTWEPLDTFAGVRLMQEISDLVAKGERFAAVQSALGIR